MRLKCLVVSRMDYDQVEAGGCFGVSKRYGNVINKLQPSYDNLLLKDAKAVTLL